MKKEFVMRGQTASGETEVLNFSGFKKGYAYRLTEFDLYPTGNIGGIHYELLGTVTAGKVAVSPINPNFNDEGLIAVAHVKENHDPAYAGWSQGIINDTFLITQDLILMIQDAGGSSYSANWQCRFVSEKMNLSQEAVANYNQFTIFDE